jgi:hypothetical protein
MLALGAIVLHGCAYPEVAAPRTAALRPTAEIKHPPTCNAAVEAKRFQIRSKPPLTWLDRVSGALTTPFKHLFTAFDGPSAWRDTGCDATGIGRALYGTQHSTDGLYTIDVAIRKACVNSVEVDENRYVRLEILPGTRAHGALRARRPQQDEVIVFSGPLIWDKDKKPDFPLGHMEIHPHEPIEYGNRQTSPPAC